MNNKWQAVSTKMYEETQEPKSDEQPTTDEATDVEFEEVK